MSRFDRNLLGALDVLLRECNVTRAAEKLGVTQPTMSGKLQRLRYQFEDELLVRNGREMELTPFAMSLVEPVRKAIEGIESLFSTELNFNLDSSAHVYRMMISDNCISLLMPRIVARLSVVAPRLRLRAEPVHCPVDRLLSGEIDVCISSDRMKHFDKLYRDERIHDEIIFTDEFICVVDKNHPLGEEATIEEYVAFPHVGVELPDHGLPVEVETVRQYVPDFQASYYVSNYQLVFELVEGTNLVGMIPRRLTGKISPTGGTVRTFAPPFKAPRVKTYMHWRARSLQDSAQRWIQQLLLEECRLDNERNLAPTAAVSMLAMA